MEHKIPAPLVYALLCVAAILFGAVVLYSKKVTDDSRCMKLKGVYDKCFSEIEPSDWRKFNWKF